MLRARWFPTTDTVQQQFPVIQFLDSAFGRPQLLECSRNMTEPTVQIPWDIFLFTSGTMRRDKNQTSHQDGKHSAHTHKHAFNRLSSSLMDRMEIRT